MKENKEEFALNLGPDMYKDYNDALRDFLYLDPDGGHEYDIEIPDSYKDIYESTKVKLEERKAYMDLMYQFLSRKERRKLSKYKGFKSFSDRIYGK